MDVNFTALMKEQDDCEENSWRNIYDFDLSLPHNLLSILSACVFLPQDFYDLIAVYYLAPSALCRILPYLFVHGASGTGKTTLTKIPRYLHNVETESSTDTFAGIRNSLQTRKYKRIKIPSADYAFPDGYTETEVNTIMVWDDIDALVLTSNPNIYRLFKFGYDRTTDKIEVSSSEIGVNEIFHCFCPKVFSSIHPLHTDPRFKELHRRLLVIPTQDLRFMHPERKAELGISGESWQESILDIDTLSWKEFHNEYKSYWDEQRGREFLATRKNVGKRVRGLSPAQRVICLDLITTGIVCGIWDSVKTATNRFKDYFEWLERDREKFGDSLTLLLKSYLQQEEDNAVKAGVGVEIYSKSIKTIVDSYVHQ